MKRVLIKLCILFYLKLKCFFYVKIGVWLSVLCRGVNGNALMHAINLKCLKRNLFLMQMNCIIRFDPNFLPSSERRRLSVVCDEGKADQCCQGSGTTSGVFSKYSRMEKKLYKEILCL